jgi:hypothetical protein
MNIAIDYDGTFTADPEFWIAIIALAEKRGHKVYCVTKREPEMGVPGIPVPVIFSSRKAKRPATELQGIHIDVWIDDDIYGILFHDGQRVMVE